jgi:hypothetical protein
VIFAGCQPLVCWRRLEIVEEDPYTNPVRVSRVLSDRELKLEDGRLIRTLRPIPSLSQRIEESGGIVELEPRWMWHDGAICAHVWVRSEFPLQCGNPWMGLIVIPLKTDSWPRWTLQRLDPD